VVNAMLVIVMPCVGKGTASSTADNAVGIALL
jgi:hypothetical protein